MTLDAVTNDKISDVRKDKTTSSFMKDVTKETYEPKAYAFIMGNGGTGFMIAKRPGVNLNGKYEATLKQFGAWRAYFIKIGKSTAFMDRRPYYMVPAEFPHMFDAQAMVLEDAANGQNFESEFLRSERLRNQKKEEKLNF